MEIHEIFDRKLKSIELTEIRINEINKRYADEYLRILSDSIDKVTELESIQPVIINSSILKTDDVISSINMTHDGAYLKLEYKKNIKFQNGYDNNLVNKLLEDKNISVKVVGNRFIDINYVKEKDKVKKI